MPFHERSTNERALTRHRFKLPRDVAFQTLPPSSALDVTSSPSSVPVAASAVIALPPLGTDKLPSQSTPLSNNVSSETSSVLSSLPSTSLPPSSSSVSEQVTYSMSSTSTASQTVSSGTPAQTDTITSGHSAKSHSLSSGAVGGIVVAIVVLALGVVGFFARRRAQHRRAMKRNTWIAGLAPALESKRTPLTAGQFFAVPPIGRDFASKPLENIPKSSAMLQSLPSSILPGLTVPPSSYNPTSPVSPLVPKSPRGAPSLRSVAPSTHSVSLGAAELAIVARTFIPSLPDELHIANGERIYILNAYDDGWASCYNSRGEQGVVPLECLQRSTNVPVEMQLYPQSQLHETNVTSKRSSSLTAHTAKSY